MVRLTKAEIQTMSEALSFTFEEASEIAEIFYTEKEKGNIRLKHARLDNVHSYIKEWEDCWYRYSSYPMCRKTPSFSYGDIRHVHRIYASN